MELKEGDKVKLISIFNYSTMYVHKVEGRNITLVPNMEEIFNPIVKYTVPIDFIMEVVKEKKENKWDFEGIKKILGLALRGL